jgi:hypothetical protein
MKVTIRSTLLTLITLALVITLAGCATPPDIPTAIATEFPGTQTAITQTHEPAGATATAEAAGPSLDSIPAEWREKIDHVETMTNMDGKTTKTVAIEKLTQEERAAGKTEAKLRVLQWDPATKEWSPYVPQVGWAGWGEHLMSNGTLIESEWDDVTLTLPDRDTLPVPLTGKDGKPLPMGEVGVIYGAEGMPDDNKRLIIQGYTLAIMDYGSGATVYQGVPLESGDWQVILYGVANQSGTPMSLYRLSSISAGFKGTSMDISREAGFSDAQIYSWLVANKASLEGQPLVTMVSVMRGIDDPQVSSFVESQQLDQALLGGENPVNLPHISPSLAPFFTTDEVIAAVASS